MVKLPREAYEVKTCVDWPAMDDTLESGPLLLLIGFIWNNCSATALSLCTAAISNDKRDTKHRESLCRALGEVLEACCTEREGRREAAAALAAAMGWAERCVHRFRPPRRGPQQRFRCQGVEDGPGGFFLTSSNARGVRRRSVDEFLNAVARHMPEFTFRETGDGGTTFSFVSSPELQDAAASLELLFLKMEAAGEGFRHVEHVTPFDAVCNASPQAVASLVERLVARVLKEPTAVAIQYQSGGHHAQDPSHPSREDYISAIAAALPAVHSVDLGNPKVIIHVRGFSWRYGVCVRLSSRRLACPTLQDDVYERCSSGQPYYKRDVNDSCAVAAEAETTELPSTQAELERWIVRLRNMIGSQLVHATPKAKEVSNTSGKEDLAGEQQVTALVEVMKSSGFTSLSSVEFGAGRGALTRALHLASDGAQSVRVLIDRDRSKGGSRQHTDECRFDEGFALRLRIDIRHFWLAGVPELQGCKVVGVGKHVCGAATDYALRCLCTKVQSRTNVVGLPESEEQAFEFLKQFSRAERKAMAKRIGGGWKALSFCEQVERLSQNFPPRVEGVAIALCCHHLCTWESYVNREWLSEHDLSPADFRLICRMSSWAVSEPLGPQAGLQVTLGRTCKDFLNVGRALFLERHGFKTDVIEYCDRSQSKENRLLLATSQAS